MPIISASENLYGRRLTRNDADSPAVAAAVQYSDRATQRGTTRVSTRDLASAASPDVRNIRLLAMKGNLNYETTTNEDVYARSSCVSAGSE